MKKIFSILLIIGFILTSCSKPKIIEETLNEKAIKRMTQWILKRTAS